MWGTVRKVGEAQIHQDWNVGADYTIKREIG